MKHIILGAGGAISRVLIDELQKQNESIKLVSRSGFQIDNTESARADVTMRDDVMRVVEKSSIVHLMIGLPYNIKVWKENWPKIMANTIEACKASGAHLVFFDNVYMYGRVNGPMTEQTPLNPCSKKGELRAQLAENLLEETKKGNLKAMIARAADFYGPYADKVSLPYIFVFSKLASGKKAQVLADASKLHSYTFTSDCGKALNKLATSPDAYGQVWHMPTARPALTGKQFIEIVADKLNVDAEFMVLRKWMVRMAGMFSTETREVHEMLYQNEFDYQFNSTKIENAFDLRATTYEEGIEKTIQFFKARGQL